MQYYRGCRQSRFLVRGNRGIGGFGGIILVLLLVGVAGIPPMGSF